MKNKLFLGLVLVLSSCASSSELASTGSPAGEECEVGVTRPFSVNAKKKGEVYIERTVGNGCSIRDRLVWGKSSIPLNEPEWRAGGLMIWKGQVALDLHKYFDGHPLECKTWVYKFGKNKLQLARKSKTCGP
jgi:hypothetical protein